MQTERPYALTIAGFDPSSGAGLSADIKTFEQMKVYGLASCTGLTLQTEDKFYSVEWRKLAEVEKELEILLQKYPVKAVKFGIVPSMDWIISLSKKIKSHSSSIYIVVDPVWKSSTGFEFTDYENKEKIKKLLHSIDLLTPNVDELKRLTQNENVVTAAAEISSHANILLKGGHNENDKGTDWYYESGMSFQIVPGVKEIWNKHGSGCVLSAAITAGLANGKTMLESCTDAKHYIEKYLTSTKNLLGFHAA